MTSFIPPSVRVLIATGCAHCATVIEELTPLVKSGQITRLKIINLAVAADKLREMDIRGLPLTEIGPFHIPGAPPRTGGLGGGRGRGQGLVGFPRPLAGAGSAG